MRSAGRRKGVQRAEPERWSPKGGVVTADAAVAHVAFAELLRRHDRKLRGLAYKLLGGDRFWMEDALQEAYLRAYRARATLRSGDEAGSWLYRIVYNACMDELRRGRRRPQPVDVESPAWERETPGLGPEEITTTADVVRRALAALPPDQRAAVVLVDGDGLDHLTAAQILGVASGTVASRLSRARRTMRAVIGEDR